MSIVLQNLKRYKVSAFESTLVFIIIILLKLNVCADCLVIVKHFYDVMHIFGEKVYTEVGERGRKYTVKKGLWFSRSQTGCH